MVRVSFLIILFLWVAACDYKSEKHPVTYEPKLEKFQLPNGQEVDLTVQRPDVNEWQSGVFSQARSCLDSICGQIEGTRVFILDDAKFKITQSENENVQSATLTFDEEIWPLLRTIIDEDFASANNNSGETAFLSRLPRRTLRVSKNVQNLYKYVYLTNLFRQIDEEDLDLDYIREHGHLKLKDAVVRSLPEDKRRETDIALKLFTRLIRNRYVQNLNLIEVHGLRVYLLFRFQELPLELAYERLRDEVTKLIQTFEKEFPIFYEVFAKNITLNKFMQGDELSPFEKKALADQLTSIYRYNQLIHGSFPELDELHFDFASIFDGQKVAEFLSNTDPDEGGQKAREVHEKSMRRAYDTCRIAISAHLATRPSKQQIESTQAVITRIKSASKLVAPKLFPGANALDLGRAIDEIEFTLPRDPESAVQLIKSEIQLLRELMLHNNSDDMNSFSDEKIENLAALMVISQVWSSQDSDDSEYSDVSDFCKQYLPEGLVDMAITVENRIIVSPATVKAPNKNFGVIAHELGHRLAFDFDQARPANTRQCLVDRHFQHQIIPGPFGKMVPRFFEEDFADFFAGAVLKEMGLKARYNNFGCILFEKILPHDGSEEIFYELTHMGHPLLHFDDDVHSAPFFRLLQIAQDMNHLTPACRAFMAAESGNTVGLDDGTTLVLPTVRQCTI